MGCRCLGWDPKHEAQDCFGIRLPALLLVTTEPGASSSTSPELLFMLWQVEPCTQTLTSITVVVFHVTKVLNSVQTSKAITPTPTAVAQEPRMSELHELLSSGWPGAGSEVCEVSLQGGHWHRGIVSRDCKSCSWAAAEGWQDLSHLFCTHTTCGPLKASCLSSVTPQEDTGEAERK